MTGRGVGPDTTAGEPTESDHQEILTILGTAVVLPTLREIGQPVVWCVGPPAGLVGELKRACPNASFIVVGDPDQDDDVVAPSGSRFPRAGVTVDGGARQWTGADSGQPLDVRVLPLSRLRTYRPERSDLLVEVGVFQELPVEQVAAIVRFAHEIGTTCLYSVTRLDRETGRQALEIERQVARYYWPHEIPLLGPPSPKRRDARPNQRSRHLVGWRRLRP